MNDKLIIHKPTHAKRKRKNATGMNPSYVVEIVCSVG